MRALGSLALALCTAGCLSQRAAHHQSASDLAAPSLPILRNTATKVVATPYAIRSYRDPDEPSVLHDEHTVYRLTRVPEAEANEGTLPRTSVASISHAPLPPSEELAAELVTQRQITAELRQIEGTIIKAQQHAVLEMDKLEAARTEAVRRQTGATASAQNEGQPPAEGSPATPPAPAHW